MQKIPSLFKRDYEGNRQVYNEVVPGCEWVLRGEGVATVKFDGTACAVIDGELYARYDAKVRSRKATPPFEDSDFKQPPPGAIPCQEPDRRTGHWPHWVKVEDQPQYKHHRIAYEACGGTLKDGTYELVGPKFQGNPYNLVFCFFVEHGETFENVFGGDPPRDFDGLRDYLEAAYDIEGIVWHHPDGRMCKIKRRDFGLKWPA